jgi:enoyl-CoA hydratase/carnithine racemase
VRKDAAQARRYAKLVNGALTAIATCRHPVIAAIQGLCVGGGLELASVCDLRLCTGDSRFGVPVKRLGLVVSYAELQPLVRLVGPANAKEILLEGRLFDAGRAREMGLVNRVLPGAGFDDGIRDSAAAIAEGAPLVARWHKKFIGRLGYSRPLSDAELEESYNCFNTEDFRIGTEAFISKTDPVFTGR